MYNKSMVKFDLYHSLMYLSDSREIIMKMIIYQSFTFNRFRCGEQVLSKKKTNIILTIK
jgi:hypothetical protein